MPFGNIQSKQHNNDFWNYSFYLFTCLRTQTDHCQSLFTHAASGAQAIPAVLNSKNYNTNIHDHFSDRKSSMLHVSLHNKVTPPNPMFAPEFTRMTMPQHSRLAGHTRPEHISKKFWQLTHSIECAANMKFDVDIVDGRAAGTSYLGDICLDVVKSHLES